MANKSVETKEFFDNLIKREQEDNAELLKGLKDFSIFTFICNKYFYYPNADDEALYAIVDGPNDGSIDSICLAGDTDSNPIELVQTKFTKDFDATVAQGEIADMAKTAQALKRHKYSLYSEKVTQRFTNCIDDTETDDIEFVYFTAAVPSEKKKKHARELIIGNKDNIQIFFGDEIMSHIECELQKTGRVDYGELRLDKPKNYLDYNGNAIIVNISAESLKTLYAKYNRSLLGLNLRYYIRNKSVDQGLKETITKHPEKFWYLNNGLVIACEKYTMDGTILKLEQFSIVNGGQTTNRIFNTDFEEDFYLPCKVVQVSTADGTQNKVTTQEIAVASNSQKPIKAKDIVANRQEQRTLEGAFKQLIPPIQYITKNGDKIDPRFKDKNSHLTLDQLGKIALASVLQMPWTRTGFKDLYDTEKPYYNLIYNTKRNLQVYADLLKIDNYYKSFINRNTTTTYPDITRNARTLALASITFASLLIQSGIKTNLDSPDEKAITKGLVEEILKLDKIIVNKLDDEEDTFITLFILLSDDVFAPSYEAAKDIDPNLVASNYLKRSDVYFKSLKKLKSKLLNHSELKTISEKLFRYN